jgi:hypothetical protein
MRFLKELDEFVGVNEHHHHAGRTIAGLENE